MSVRVSKPEFNLREKLSELDKPTGVKGLDLMGSDTAQKARNLIGAGRKNKVINGDMRISQRGTTFSNIGGSTEVYTLDRFKLQTNDLDQAVATISQDSSAPDGFSKSLKIQCDTAETAVENSEHARLMYDGEAFDFTDIGFGTPSAKKVTLSFWVKSNLTGTWGINFWRGDANRSNLRTYTINNANTWEHKVMTLSADPTGGVVNSDNGFGFRINWGLATGANFATSHPLDTWHGFQQQYFYPYDARNTNFYSSTSNNFYLTGVQLEVSDVATEFEHRHYKEELELCQRYFSVYHACTQEWIYFESSINNHKWWQTYVPTGMRGEPSVTLKGTCSTNNISAGGGTISGLSVQAIDNGGNAGTAHPGSMGRVSYRVAFSADHGGSYEIRHTDGWGNGNGWVEYNAEI